MATSKKSKSALTDILYPKVEKSCKDKDTLTTYKRNVDTFLADNADFYFSDGPSGRPIFSDTKANEYIHLLGFTDVEIKEAVKQSSTINPKWFMATPYNLLNAIVTRYFLIKDNKEYVDLTISYLIFKLYPPLEWRYFKKGINEACMMYTINNLSNKFGIKSATNLWGLLMDICHTGLEHFRDKLIKGDDQAYIDYLNSIQTRMNSMLRNLSHEFYNNYENGRYLKMEHESFEEDKYYEADSNSYVIERITNKVTTHLVVHGPDSKLVELSAKTNKVSVNKMRNYTDTMIVENHVDDIKHIIESILFLYLFNDDGDAHAADQIKTNDFMIYCLQTYRRSNSSNKNIIAIKTILDRWIEELGVSEESNRTATITSFRKAFYTFFVMEIQQNA